MRQSTKANSTISEITGAENHGIDLEQELQCGYAARFINFKIRQLIGRVGLTRSDRLDLVQEMKLRLYRRASQFDPRLSDWPAFVTTIVERHVATILQTRSRLKRAGENDKTSLSELVENADGEMEELSETIGQVDRERMTGRRIRSDTDVRDLMSDVAAVVAGLPKDLQEICRELQSKSIRQLARERGIPRSALCRPLSRIKEAFEEAGIRDFL